MPSCRLLTIKDSRSPISWSDTDEDRVEPDIIDFSPLYMSARHDCDKLFA